MKQCSRCRQQKAFDQFYKKSRSGTFGLQPYCKPCSLEIAKTPASYARARLRNRTRYQTDTAYRERVRAQVRVMRSQPEEKERQRQLYVERMKDPEYAEMKRRYCRERYARLKAAGRLPKRSPKRS